MANGEKLTIGEKNFSSKITELELQPVVGEGSNAAALGLYNPGYVGLASGGGVFGVLGTSQGTGAGVRGVSYLKNGDGSGVEGYGEGRGVEGQSTEGVGVYGESAHYHGVVGKGLENGVYGWSKSGVGVVGQTFRDARHRESFGVFAWGNMGCTGAKHAAVPHKDGGYRLLYSIESPECWFEDFGRSVLRRGQASVAISKDFRALVKTNDYHIFLTPEGDCSGLFVTRKTRAGFQVRESQNGKATLKFSYRIVAKRRDISAPRLPKMNLKEPKPPKRARRSIDTTLPLSAPSKSADNRARKGRQSP